MPQFHHTPPSSFPAARAASINAAGTPPPAQTFHILTHETVAELPRTALTRAVRAMPSIALPPPSFLVAPPAGRPIETEIDQAIGWPDRTQSFARVGRQRAAAILASM
jgi:hypothetical protein